MNNPVSQNLRPYITVKLVTVYVARWPFRHVYGGAWLRDYFAEVLRRIGPRSISEVYGLEFRDSVTPPKIRDVFIVSVMQAAISLAIMALAWTSYRLTSDYVVPAFILFSVFHVIPSDRDFLTSGDLADRVPRWLTPVSSALSFVVSLPAMIAALPAAVIWGCVGTAKYQFTNSRKH